MPANKKDESFSQERRQYVRVTKNFILTYYEKDRPGEKHEITQLKNISLGGMCFITTKSHTPKTHLAIELKTPYLANITYLEGTVQMSHEKVKGILYETRVKFESLNTEAEYLLSKMIEFFVNGELHDSE